MKCHEWMVNGPLKQLPWQFVGVGRWVKPLKIGDFQGPC
jgi:hypothetical protein